jgi:integrase
MATLRKRGDSPYWWLYWNVNGEQFYQSSGIRHDNSRNKKPARNTDAHRFLVAFENKIAFSSLGISTLHDITCTELLDKFMADYQSQAESGAIKEQVFDDKYGRVKIWRKQLKRSGITTVKALTPARALDYRNNRKKPNGESLSPTTWNREVTDLITIWKFAKDKMGVEAKNEWKHMKIANAKPKTEKRALTDDEINTLFERGHELGQEWMFLTYMMYFTGCRISSAVQLRVDSVHFDERKIWLSNKNSADHNAYIPTQLMEFLQSYKPAGETWVTNPSPRYWTPKWFREIKKIGLTFSTHYMRNTYVTKLTKKLDQRVTMNIVGHSDAKVHELYNRNTAWEHAAEIERSLCVRFLQNESDNVTVLKSVG